MFQNDMYGHVPARRPMATASLVLGILSLFLCSVIYLALPLGALAIIFAILSHTDYTMTGKSKAGLVCGLCGILASVIITVSAFYYVLSNPLARSYLEYYIQMYTGDSDFDLDDDLLRLLPGGQNQDAEQPPVTVPDEGGQML